MSRLLAGAPPAAQTGVRFCLCPGSFRIAAQGSNVGGSEEGGEAGERTDLLVGPDRRGGLGLAVEPGAGDAEEAARDDVVEVEIQQECGWWSILTDYRTRLLERSAVSLRRAGDFSGRIEFRPSEIS